MVSQLSNSSSAGLQLGKAKARLKRVQELQQVELEHLWHCYTQEELEEAAAEELP